MSNHSVVSIKSLIIPLRFDDLSDKLAVFVTLNHVESWVERLRVRFTALTNESFEGKFIAVHSGHAKSPSSISRSGSTSISIPSGSWVYHPAVRSLNALDLQPERPVTGFCGGGDPFNRIFAVYEISSIENAPACTQESNGYS